MSRREVNEELYQRLLELRAQLDAQPDQVVARLKQSCFAEQLAFVDDRSPNKVALCSRRAAKTYALAVMLVICCLLHPGAETIYATNTKLMADTNFNVGCMRRLVDLFKLPVVWTKGVWQFHNGSRIIVAGLDVNQKEKDKMRGAGRRMVVIDEIQSFRTDVKELLKSAIEPSLFGTDRDNRAFRGQLVIAGTPGDVPDTYFHKITEGQVPGWSLHHWTVEKNPFQADIVMKDLSEAEAREPNFRLSASYRREWLGEWVLEDTSRVYDYRAVTNDADKLPEGELTYVLGVDLGYEDDTAYVIVAWSAYDPVLYVTYVDSENHKDLDHIVDRIKDLKSKFSFRTIVVDGSNKLAVKTINQRLGIDLTPADERWHKDQHIRLFNTDLHRGRIKLLSYVREEVTAEWDKLVWDPTKLKQGKRVEHKGQKNHVSDALLYAWFESRNYQVEAAPPPKDPEMERWQFMVDWALQNQSLLPKSALDLGDEDDWGEDE